MAISDALKKIYASAPPAGVPGSRYVETLQLHHPGFTTTDHYITNDVNPWTFELETGGLVEFMPVPFALVLPRSDGEGRQDMQITIGNIGRVIMQELEQAVLQPTEHVDCTYRVYLDVPESLPQNDPVMSLTIAQITAQTQAITCIAGRADILNRTFPLDIYRIDRFPGLDR